MITERQKATYHFIREYYSRNGRAPKLNEIADGIGINSKGVIHRYLKAIAAEGLIEIIPGRHRGIRLTENSATDEEKYSLPLAGKIVAGQPIEAIPHQDTFNLANFCIGLNRYVLKVQGDSMIDAGILDGDMVIVEKTDYADNGKIVVALIDKNEATLKRIQINKNGDIVLIPANKFIKQMIYSSDRVSIQGVVVAQLRSYK